MIKKFFTYLIISILLWNIISLLSNNNVPNIFNVYDQFTKQYDVVLTETLYSLLRLVVGIILSIIIGLTIALLMFENKTTDKLLTPIVYAWMPIPKVALTPIFIILFGLGEFTKILLIISIVVVPIIVQVKSCLSSIPKENFQIIEDYNISKRSTILKIYFRAISYELFAVLKISIGTSIAILYVAESSFGTQHGLGHYISVNMGTNVDGMLLGIVILSFIGLILFIIVDELQRRMCKWQLKDS
ncbi:MAG: ABC transporter permease [Mycoplasmatales bacterium]